MKADMPPLEGPAEEGSSWIPSSYVGRRTVVQAAALTAGVAALGLSPLATDVADASVRRLRRSTFTPLVGRAFRATGHDVSQRLVLLEVADLEFVPRLPKAERAEYREKSFVLRFSTTRAVPSGTYHLTNPRFGTAKVFLSSVDRTSERLVEAVFNRYQG